ncbi:MAG: ribosome-associated translation inhibitor RaiA [Deltaproteobacteria bacterium]|nr:ribosome-associated translation inhibitor RaiA [Deltaproteobacteria bacterium]
MKVVIQGKQLRLSDDLKSYVHDRLVRPLTRFYDDSAAELRVEFGDTNGPKGGEDKECHLTLHLPGVRTIQIEETTQDSYASLDAASDRLIRVVHRELDRMREPAGHPKEHPLGSVVSEGGVPGGPIEELPDAEAIEQVSSELER